MTDKPMPPNDEALRVRLHELEEELSFYHNLMNYIPGHVYWLDQNNVYMGCNWEHAKNIGLKNRLDIVGKTNQDMPWKEIAELVDQTNQEVMHTGESITIKETGLIKGVQTTFLSQKVPLKNKHHDIVGILGISINITEIEQLQQSLMDAKKIAEAGSRAKTEFLENMRHDIRTPLSGIVGFAEILKNESNEPHTKEYADNLMASSFALLDLMDEVLEAIRVSSGEIPLLKQKFEIKVLLKQIIDLNLAKSKEKQLQLNFLIDNDVPRYVVGDKIRIHRIILELVSNALNFTHKGHVTLTVALAKKHERHLVLRIKVCDSGMGIPVEKQKDIYLQFKRLTPSYQGIYKGAGLGLYIVRQFIDELGAEISVESQVGVGSTFTCIIPLQEPLLDDASGVDNDMPAPNTPLFSAHPHEQTQQAGTSKRNSRILVVEDNVIAQKVAKTILNTMNCEVDVAANGKEALTQINNHHYDLIFMDI